MTASKDFVEACMAIIKATTEEELGEAAQAISDNKELSGAQAERLLAVLKSRGQELSEEPDKLGVLEIVDDLF